MVAIGVSVGEYLALSVFVRLVCSLYWALCGRGSLWSVGWTGMALLQVVRRCSSTGGVRVSSVVGSGSGLVVAWVCGEGGTVYSSIWLLIGEADIDSWVLLCSSLPCAWWWLVFGVAYVAFGRVA